MATINVGMQCYFIISLFIFIICTFLLRFIFKNLTSLSSTTHLRLPPSPPALPLIGHLHLMSLTVHKSVTDICTKYGPLLYLRIGSMPCVVVSSAAVAMEIFKTHDVNFSYRPQSIFGDSIFLGNLGMFAAAYGDYWRFMKKLCVTDLLGARHLQDLLVAGISGTDEGVKWAIAELINHPDAFNKAREEIESVVGRNRLVEESDIQNLPFLQAVVKETLEKL